VSQQSEELKRRTKRFAIDVCKLLKIIPYEEPGPTVRKQLAKSATSVAANYRATCRARSRPEFISKLGTVVEETDEALFWLEFARDAKLATNEAVAPLVDEAGQLAAIFAKSLGTARRNSGTSINEITK
jgi:four helix bundle protein